MDGNEPAASRTSLFRSARQWWNDIAARHGHVVAARRFMAELWEFARDSTPERRRLRYGDAEFDWDHRVDTTSGTLSLRDRLWGIFHSPYQPTEADLFHEMLSALRAKTGCEFSHFVFLDLGSGKGRVLLMASEYPFRRIVGVELLPELHRVAVENLVKYKSENQKCFALESICADAAEFRFPADPLVLYLFNPLPEAGLRRVLANLEQGLGSTLQKSYAIYHNPLLEHLLSANPAWKKIGGTHQYALYEGSMILQNFTPPTPVHGMPPSVPAISVSQTAERKWPKLQQ